jgi:hypothetical protein
MIVIFFAGFDEAKIAYMRVYAIGEYSSARIFFYIFFVILQAPNRRNFKFATKLIYLPAIIYVTRYLDALISRLSFARIDKLAVELQIYVKLQSRAN